MRLTLGSFCLCGHGIGLRKWRLWRLWWQAEFETGASCWAFNAIFRCRLNLTKKDARGKVGKYLFFLDCSLQFKQSMTMFANIMSTYVNICEDQQRRSIQCYTVHAMLNRYSQYSLYKATNACVVVGTGWSMPWHNVWARPLCLCSRWKFCLCSDATLKSTFKRMFNVFSFPFTNTLIEVPRCNTVCADNGNELCSALKPRGGAWHGIYFKLESCKAIQLCVNVKVSPLAGPRKSLW